MSAINRFGAEYQRKWLRLEIAIMPGEVIAADRVASIVNQENINVKSLFNRFCEGGLMVYC